MCRKAANLNELVQYMQRDLTDFTIKYGNRSYTNFCKCRFFTQITYTDYSYSVKCRFCLYLLFYSFLL